MGLSHLVLILFQRHASDAIGELAFGSHSDQSPSTGPPSKACHWTTCPAQDWTSDHFGIWHCFILFHFSRQFFVRNSSLLRWATTLVSRRKEHSWTLLPSWLWCKVMPHSYPYRVHSALDRHQKSSWNRVKWSELVWIILYMSECLELGRVEIAHEDRHMSTAISAVEVEQRGLSGFNSSQHGVRTGRSFSCIDAIRCQHVIRCITKTMWLRHANCQLY